MRQYFLFLFLLLLLSSCFKRGIVESKSKPILHIEWTDLLQANVTEDGKVDYEGFIQDRQAFNAYIENLKSHHPNNSWSDDEQLAYWINAYNAFTVKLVIDHYPVKSIKEIGTGPNIPFVNSPWDIKFFKIEGNEYDLNDIEHGIIRPTFNDPRVHFAVNCASFSCPNLANEAFEAETIDEQLDARAKYFINNPMKNEIGNGSYNVSKIFSWYGKDFEKDESDVISFINRYAEEKIPEGTKLKFLDYSWELND